MATRAQNTNFFSLNDEDKNSLYQLSSKLKQQWSNFLPFLADQLKSEIMVDVIKSMEKKEKIINKFGKIYSAFGGNQKVEKMKQYVQECKDALNTNLEIQKQMLSKTKYKNIQSYILNLPIISSELENKISRTLYKDILLLEPLFEKYLLTQIVLTQKKSRTTLL